MTKPTDKHVIMLDNENGIKYLICSIMNAISYAHQHSSEKIILNHISLSLLNQCIDERMPLSPVEYCQGSDDEYYAYKIEDVNIILDRYSGECSIFNDTYEENKESNS